MTSTRFLNRRDAQNGGKWLAPDGEKWQEIPMPHSKASNQKAPKNRGRPFEARLSAEKRKNIKNEIKGIYNSLTAFYKEAFNEACDSKYKALGFKPPVDVKTVKDAFAHFFSGARPLPPLYWKVLEQLLEIFQSAPPPPSAHREEAVTTSRNASKEPARQLAYTFFMDMTNRKVALPIDWDNDTLLDVYTSWKSFFDNSVALLKHFPVEHAVDASSVIKLLQEVLHQVLRPHLTRWQAAYRRWHDTNNSRKEFRKLPPQEVQKRFPQFTALRNDFEATQTKVSKYARKLEDLIYQKECI